MKVLENIRRTAEEGFGTYGYSECETYEGNAPMRRLNLKQRKDRFTLEQRFALYLQRTVLGDAGGADWMKSKFLKRNRIAENRMRQYSFWKSMKECFSGIGGIYLGFAMNLWEMWEDKKTMGYIAKKRKHNYHMLDEIKDTGKTLLFFLNGGN